MKPAHCPDAKRDCRYATIDDECGGHICIAENETDCPEWQDTHEPIKLH